MREPNFFKKWKNFAVIMTFSLRKGIPTTHIHYVKKKRRLFSVPIPPCRSFVALPRNLPHFCRGRRFRMLEFWQIPPPSQSTNKLERQMEVFKASIVFPLIFKEHFKYTRWKIKAKKKSAKLLHNAYFNSFSFLKKKK
jgi:hypothetical protein